MVRLAVSGFERRASARTAGGGSDRARGLAVVIAVFSLVGFAQGFFGLAAAVAPGIGPQDVAWIDQFGTQTFGHPLWVGADSVAVDGAGNVYVGGGMGLGAAFPDQVEGGGEDAYVRKFDPQGNLLWTRQFGGPGNEWLSGLSADAAGVYVSGTTWGAGLPGQPFSGAADAYVVVYDPNGNPRWSRGFGTSAEDLANHVMADATGVYVTGTTWGTLPGQTTSGANDIFVRKYDPSGTELWTHQFGAGGLFVADSVQGVALDATPGYEGVYAVGATSGTLPGQTSAGGTDAFAMMFDRSGNRVWTRQFGTGSTDQALGVAATYSDLYVVGLANGALPGETSLGGQDAFLVKLALPPIHKIQLVAGEVARLVADGTLNRGQGNSLTAKLEAAAAQLAKGNPIPAANMLHAFANEVAAIEASGRLPSSEAALLIAWAGNIIDQID